MPELVRRDDQFVETFIASVVAFFRNKMDVCDELSEIVRGGKISQTRVLESAAVKPRRLRKVRSEINANLKVAFCEGYSNQGSKMVLVRKTEYRMPVRSRLNCS